MNIVKFSKRQIDNFYYKCIIDKVTDELRNSNLDDEHYKEAFDSLCEQYLQQYEMHRQEYLAVFEYNHVNRAYLYA